MLINKNGFYKLSEIEDSKIIIDKWVIASFYDDWNKKIDVELFENSRVDFFWFYKNKGDFWVNFIQNEDNSNLKVRYLLLSNENLLLKSKIYSKISSNNSLSDMKVISIVSERLDLTISSSVGAQSVTYLTLFHCLDNVIYAYFLPKMSEVK